MKKCCSLFFFLLASAASLGDSISLTPVADTTLFEFAPDYNLGAQVDLPSGTLGNSARARMLMRFPVSDQLPQNAVISSAHIKVSVTRAPNVQPVFFELHRVLVPWTEGLQSGAIPGGAQALEGESTWNHRLVPDGAWSQAGGEFGQDFALESSASERVAGVGSYFFELNNRGLTDLQDWLNHPEQNQGWILVTRDESVTLSARRFAAREDPVLSPVLEIEFTQSQSLQIGKISVSRSESQMLLSHAGLPMVLYSLEYRSSLDEGIWELQETKGPFDAELDVEWVVPLSGNPTPAFSPKSFFRVKASPFIP